MSELTEKSINDLTIDMPNAYHIGDLMKGSPGPSYLLCLFVSL